jgi:hypothetical protein
MYAQIQIRRDSIASWVDSGSMVLAQGEFVLEYNSSSLYLNPSESVRIKIGDGVHTYSQLPYYADNLPNLLDVTITTPGNFNLLAYNSSTFNWENISTGSLNTLLSFINLNDVANNSYTGQDGKILQISGSKIDFISTSSFANTNTFNQFTSSVNSYEQLINQYTASNNTNIGYLNIHSESVNTWTASYSQSVYTSIYNLSASEYTTVYNLSSSFSESLSHITSSALSGATTLLELTDCPTSYLDVKSQSPNYSVLLMVNSGSDKTVFVEDTKYVYSSSFYTYELNQTNISSSFNSRINTTNSNITSLSSSVYTSVTNLSSSVSTSFYNTQLNTSSSVYLLSQSCYITDVNLSSSIPVNLGDLNNVIDLGVYPNGYVLSVSGSKWIGSPPSSSAGSTYFTNLLDVPNSYSSSANYIPQVNPAENGLIFLNTSSFASSQSLYTFETNYSLDSSSFNTNINNTYLSQSNYLLSADFNIYSQSYVSDSSSFDYRIDQLDMSSSELINITYSQLSSSIYNQTLTTGKHYKITDYQTVHNILDGNTITSDIHTGSIEPLVVFSISTGSIDKTAISTVYPQDTIYYDITGGDTRDIAFFGVGVPPPTYTVDDINNSIPLGPPEGYSVVILPGSPSPWNTHIHQITTYISSNWTYASASINEYAYVTSNTNTYMFSGTSWNLITPELLPVNGFKGLITYRKDTIRNNECYYDFRNIIFRRWKVNATGWVSSGSYTAKDIVSGSNDYLYKAKTTHSESIADPSSDAVNWQFWLNNFKNYSWTSTPSEFSVGDITTTNLSMSDPLDYYTFTPYDEYCYDNHINIISFDNNGYYSRLNNIVFGSTCYSNNIKSDGYTITIGDSCYSNTIRISCYSNVIGDTFQSNNIGRLFQSNVIGDSFQSNTIGDSFQSNTIGNTNIFGYSFYSNTIGNSFQSNNIREYFNSNIIGDGCYSNNIRNSFSVNNIRSSFYLNTIGDSFQSNNIRDGFNSNIIGDSFQSNNIEYCPNNIDFTSATYVYGAYNCTIYNKSDGTFRLNYYDGTDILHFVNITD